MCETPPSSHEDIRKKVLGFWLLLTKWWRRKVLQDPLPGQRRWFGYCRTSWWDPATAVVTWAPGSGCGIRRVCLRISLSALETVVIYDSIRC